MKTENGPKIFFAELIFWVIFSPRHVTEQGKLVEKDGLVAIGTRPMWDCRVKRLVHPPYHGGWL